MIIHQRRNKEEEEEVKPPVKLVYRPQRRKRNLTLQNGSIGKVLNDMFSKTRSNTPVSQMVERMHKMDIKSKKIVKKSVFEDWSFLKIK